MAVVMAIGEAHFDIKVVVFTLLKLIITIFLGLEFY